MVDSPTEKKRIIAIGDIHGCIHSLQRLIDKLELQETDQLVFLGDYIDRGKHSKEVIDCLLKLREQYHCFFLMGNHERMFLDYLETHESSLWLRNGGIAVLESYNSKDGLDLPEKHIAFMRSCRYHIETEHFFFAHGGIDPEMSIKDNLRYMKPEDYCWMRTHLRSNYLENNRYNWEKTVVCGHTPLSQPVLLEKLIAIDTGCVYKDSPSFGWLSAVILPERRIVQTENIDF
ncbi:metallophosphoesterase family protein [Prosthecochloris sp.]|uniref:metallophosphoesterase family protein n=1 Tax=Prosthecochloris sp. TaxID=290513 RepID=UPI0025FD6045|nr:metallophosphoesterase family protein [Prosthecochloris sp.]